MKAFLRVFAWFGLTLFLAVSAWFAWPLLFPSYEPGLLSRLAKADSALAQGRADEAKRLLTPWPEEASASQWLQWQKRVRAVVLQTKQWSWASEGAQKAVSRFPGNPELSAFFVWSLLGENRAAEALLQAEKALPGTRWEPLLRQARVETLMASPKDFPESWTQLRQALSTPLGTAALYRRVARALEDPTTVRNALLASLGTGELDEAKTLISSLSSAELDRAPFDRLPSLMAYDDQDWVRAAALLRNLPRLDSTGQLILADVYLHLNELEQARLIYDQLLADDPSAATKSTALAVNRSMLALIQDEPGKALVLANQGIRSAEAGQQTGSEDQLRLILLEARFLLGEEAEVLQALNSQLGRVPVTDFALQVELLKDRLFPELQSVPRLWTLLNQFPSSAPLAERLAWMLLAERDYSASRRALALWASRTERKGEDSPWWHLTLQAMLAALEKNGASAISLYERIPENSRDLTYFANLSQVQMLESRQPDREDKAALLENALENVTRALDLLPPKADQASLSLRSRLLTQRGSIEWALVAWQKPSGRKTFRNLALDDLNKAAQLDPENLRAAFLLRQTATLQETP